MICKKHLNELFISRMSNPLITLSQSLLFVFCKTMIESVSKSRNILRIGNLEIVKNFRFVSCRPKIK